jgi:hypothetical protein
MYPIAVGRHLTIKRTAHTAISKGVRSMAGTVTSVERIAATRPVFEPWKRPYFAGYFSETPIRIGLRGGGPLLATKRPLAGSTNTKRRVRGTILA